MKNSSPRAAEAKAQIKRQAIYMRETTVIGMPMTPFRQYCTRLCSLCGGKAIDCILLTSWYNSPRRGHSRLHHHQRNDNFRLQIDIGGSSSLFHRPISSYN